MGRDALLLSRGRAGYCLFSVFQVLACFLRSTTVLVYCCILGTHQRFWSVPWRLLVRCHLSHVLGSPGALTCIRILRADVGLHMVTSGLAVLHDFLSQRSRTSDRRKRPLVDAAEWI